MEVIIYIFITAIFATLATMLILTKYQVNKIKETLFYTNLHNALLKEEIKTQQQNLENAKLASDDSFIKFLSESREWAFEYIEKVQEGIANFKNKVNASVKYYEKAGYMGDSMHKNSLETFIKAYRELEEFLPTEDETKEKK